MIDKTLPLRDRANSVPNVPATDIAPPQSPRRTWRQWSKLARVRIGFVMMLIVTLSLFVWWLPRRNVIAVMWDGGYPYFDNQTDNRLDLLWRRLPNSCQLWVSPKIRKLLGTDEGVRAVDRHDNKFDGNWLRRLGKFRRLGSVTFPAEFLGTELDHLRNCPIRGVTVVSLTPESDLGELRRLKEVEDVAVSNTSPLGGGWQNLREVPSLKSVSVNLAGSTASLHELCSKLGSVTQLESLIISGSLTALTEADLRELARLPKMKTLFLIGCGLIPNEIVGGSSLAPLSQMNSLEQLTIKSCPATDDDLQVLSSLSKLRHLTITGSRITDDGIARFKSSLPNCSVILTAPTY